MLLTFLGSSVIVPVGLVLFGYGFLGAEACAPQLLGRCSPIPGYTTELVGAVMLSVSLQAPMRALIWSWRDSTNKAWLLASTGASIFAGAIIGYALYYLSVRAGLVVANDPCGTYLSPYSCVEYDPVIPILFVFSGSILSFTTLALSRRIRALNRPESLSNFQKNS